MSWPAFWAEHRLKPQLDLARQSGYGGHELQAFGSRVLDRLDTLLASPPEAPALLHGDLWSGNYMVGPAGDPVIVDPACYFGHREADFGMITLFGGLSARFHAAYSEIHPLADNADERFGTSYLADSIAILRRFA
jgi:fructosamine-3-kinase